jgi:acyl-CoA thioesterase-1
MRKRGLAAPPTLRDFHDETHDLCGGGSGGGLQRAPAAQPAGPLGSAAPSRPKIVVLGDSLTAGLGLLQSQAYPERLQARLDQLGYDVEVVNAGVSGDTTAGGLRRLDWVLDDQVRILVVALGGNDALRGLSIDDMQRNLGQIIERAQARGVEVLLAGMEAPPNFGEQYTARFRAVFPALARQYHVTLLPFLLAGVAGHPDLNQADGIHPNARGAEIVADTVWQALQPMVDRVTQR